MEKTTMSVQELSSQLGISLPKAYELVKSEGFSSIRIGTRILIPVDAFREWLVITSNKSPLGNLKSVEITAFSGKICYNKCTRIRAKPEKKRAVWRRQVCIG